MNPLLVYLITTVIVCSAAGFVLLQMGTSFREAVLAAAIIGVVWGAIFALLVPA